MPASISLLPRGRTHDPLAVDMAAARLRQRLFGVRAPTPRVGRYVLMERLGEGAGGVVYAAFDPQLERRIAIKLIASGPGTDGAWPDERALVEAKAMARLSHPHIVGVHDVGLEHLPDRPEPLLFIAMERVEGSTLQAWLEQPRSWDELRRVFVGAARGLRAAHEAGLVHRDFKPANVMVTEGGAAKVLDFGVATLAATAAALPSEPGEVTALETAKGRVVGTPAYMAPEQHRGEPAGPAADQYALCASLWHALHGEPPFTGDTMDELLQAKLAGPPSGSTAGPSFVHAVMLRGLQPEAAHRHPDMASVIERLEHRPRWRRALLPGAVTLAAGGSALAATASMDRSPCASAQELRDQHWDEGARTAVSRGLRAVPLGYAEATADTVLEQLDAWVEGWSRARSEACETYVDGVHDPVVADMQRACLDRAAAGLDRLIATLVEADARVLERAVQMSEALVAVEECRPSRWATAPVPRDPAARARQVELEEMLDRAREAMAAGRPERALAEARTALDEARAAGLEPLLTRALLEQGRAEQGVGRPDQSLATLQRAAWSSRRHGLPTTDVSASLEVVDALGRRGEHARARDWLAHAAAVATDEPGLAARLALAEAVMSTREGRPNDAVESLTVAARHHERDPAGSPETKARILAQRASADLDRGHLDEAIEGYARALEVVEPRLGSDHPMVLDVRANRAAVMNKAGRIAEARDLTEDVLRRRRAVLGPRHPDVIDTLNNLANIHNAQGDHARADSLYAEALVLAESVHGAQSLELVPTLGNQGGLRSALGDHQGALISYDRALSIARLRLAADHPTVGQLSLMYGQTLVFLERHAEALEHLRRGVASIESSVEGPHELIAEGLHLEGMAHLGLDAPGPAAEVLERAVAMGERVEGIAPDERAWYHAHWAQALRRSGRPERARAAVEAGLERATSGAEAEAVLHRERAALAGD